MTFSLALSCLQSGFGHGTLGCSASCCSATTALSGHPHNRPASGSDREGPIMNHFHSRRLPGIIHLGIGRLDRTPLPLEAATSTPPNQLCSNTPICLGGEQQGQ